MFRFSSYYPHRRSDQDNDDTPAVSSMMLGISPKFMLCTCQVILPLTYMVAIMCRFKKHLKLSQLLKQLDNELALEYNFEMSVTISKTCIMFLSTNTF